MVPDAETLRARADTGAGRAVEAAWVRRRASEHAWVSGRLEAFCLCQWRADQSDSRSVFVCFRLGLRLSIPLSQAVTVRRLRLPREREIGREVERKSARDGGRDKDSEREIQRIQEERRQKERDR